MSRCFMLLAACGAAFAPLSADAVTVHVPADAGTIQAGIDLAVPGDTVEIACGTYYESYVVMKSGVVLRSATGDPGCVTIDAQRNNRVMHCQGMNAATRVEGITLINGYSSASGGLWCVNSLMTIENCVFEDNEVVHDSAAIGLFHASPVIRGCVFRNNRTSDALLRNHNRGGAIYIQEQCYPIIEDCTFVGNRAFLGGAIWCNIASPTIRRCRFESNIGLEGGGVSIENSPFVLEECVFLGNSASEGGGLRLNNADGVVDHCTFVANTAPTGGQVLVMGAVVPSIVNTIVAFGAGSNAVECAAGSAVGVACTDVFLNVGGDWTGCLTGMAGANGNFSADPAFCDVGSGNVTLRSDSPCAPPGPTGCGLVGALGVGCGPVGVDATSWGQLKSRYRTP